MRAFTRAARFSAIRVHEVGVFGALAGLGPEGTVGIGVGTATGGGTGVSGRCSRGRSSRSGRSYRWAFPRTAGFSTVRGHVFGVSRALASISPVAALGMAVSTPTSSRAFVGHRLGGGDGQFGAADAGAARFPAVLDQEGFGGGVGGGALALRRPGRAGGAPVATLTEHFTAIWADGGGQRGADSRVGGRLGCRGVRGRLLRWLTSRLLGRWLLGRWLFCGGLSGGASCG